MTTHRCKGSLAQGVSIRYTYSVPWNREYAWRLFSNSLDGEYGVCIPMEVAEIKYCPFCGKELEEVEDNKA